ncbi:MAG: tRNA (N(6)-L-threonylcarbamoyladenosine(37)-C(2))-methylthiotransferase MtaB [Acidobacteria bacterium]|nr:MAG: tRNA (N(6)-L-threonylcarbamoyladenosine(37)-C(2))-methylthiotransferase MtaB [Acidobacteriota bacterium]
MPTYRIVTLGCKLNQADSAALEARLRVLGFRRAPRDPDDAAGADVVILNTCTVTANADREARQIARRLRGAHPGALLIATGCYAERDPAGLGAIPGIDHVVPLREQEQRVPALAAAAFGIDPDRVELDLGTFGTTEGCEPEFGPGDRTRALLKVQDGCNLRCSYCIIPSVRGSSRSLPPRTVLERLARMVESGFREIVLTGVNTGDYGKDLDPPLSLVRLLEQAIDMQGLGRIRLNSLEPKTVGRELVGLLAACGGRVAPHLQVPLQSGSDAVLARMRRPYRAADYARLVEHLRREVEGIALGADVIVGFPGETDGEFETTCRFIESSPLNYLHVFSYSPRPGTAAVSSPGQVPPYVIKERSARLRRLARDLSLRFRSAFVDRSRSALTLREVRPDGRLRALTDNFIDVGCDPEGRDPVPMMNRLLRVRITEVLDHDTLGVIADD